MIEDNSYDFNISDEFEQMLDEFVNGNLAEDYDDDAEQGDDIEIDAIEDADGDEGGCDEATRRLTIDGAEYDVPASVDFCFKYKCQDSRLYANGKTLASNERLMAFNREDFELKGIAFEGCDFGDSAGKETLDALLYRVGEPKPLWHEQFRPFGNDIFINLEECAAKIKTGEYFFLFSSLDLAGVPGCANMEVGSVARFAVLEPNYELPCAELVQVAAKGDVFTFKFSRAVGSERVFELLAYDADTLTLVETTAFTPTRRAKTQKARIDCDGLGWTPGRYAFGLFANDSLQSVFEGEYAGGKWVFGPIGQALLPEPSNLHFRLAHGSERHAWREFAKLPVGRKVKESLLRWIGYGELGDRLKLLGLTKRRPPMRIAFVADCNAASIKMAEAFFNLAMRDSLKVVDCAAMLEQREGKTPQQFDGSGSCLGDEACMLIANIGALANAKMGDVVSQLIGKLSDGTLKCCLLLGARQEVGQLLEMHPALGHFFAERLELAEISPADALRSFYFAVRRDGMRMAPQEIAKLLGQLEGAKGQRAWTLQGLDSHLRDTAYPRFYERLTLSGEAQFGIDALACMRADDFAIGASAQSGDAYAEAMRELNELTGLGALKDKLHLLFDQMRFEQMRLKAGLGGKGKASYHTIFTGNPGTGKTTVAKLMGKIYRSLGILSKGDAIIVDRSRIVGQFIGDTEANMRNLLEQARGNVLFIDEAYTLRSDPSDKRDYGGKALDTLLPVLSQANPDMVVVLAGYEKEMNVMLSSNPGLASRFAVKLQFPDYTAAELCEIAGNMLGRQSYELAPEAADALAKGVERAVAAKGKDFGNARWAEQLVEHGILPAMARRVMRLPSPTVDDLRQVRPIDVEQGLAAMAQGPAPRRQVGF